MTTLAIRLPRRRVVRPTLGFATRLVLAVLFEPQPARVRPAVWDAGRPGWH
jgi:hypothetical protein